MADVSVSIVIDQELYTRIEQEAAEREQSPGEAIAQVLADVYGHAASQAQQAQASQATQQTIVQGGTPQPTLAATEPINPSQPGAPNFPPPSPAVSAEVAGPAEAAVSEPATTESTPAEGSATQG